MLKPRLKTQNFLILATIFCLPFYFIKFKYGWASLNLIEILILTLFVVWVLNKERKYSILNTQYSISVGLILAGIASSILVNKNYYVGFGVLKGWFLFPIIFAIILYDNLRRDNKLLDKILVVIFASGTFVAIEGIYYWLSNLVTYDGRLRIFFDSPNQLAMFLAPALLAGLKFGFEELRAPVGKGKAELWKKILAVVGTVTIMSNLYLTKSYGAWLSVGMVLVVFFWLKYRKNIKKSGVVCLLIILIIFLGWATVKKHKDLEISEERSSLNSRLTIWKSAGLMIKNNPLFGIGPGNFQNTYLNYQKYFPPYLEWAVPQPHNLYLAFWLESGLMGFIGFVWLLVLFFRDNKKAIENDRLLGVWCLAAMLYFLTHGIVDTTYWRNDMAIIFWLIVAVNLFLAEKNQRPNIKNQIHKPKFKNISVFSL